MEIKITDNSDQVKEELQAAAIRALEKCGLTAEGYAKPLCPVDTGLLRNSITYALGGQPPAISSYRADKPDESGETKKGDYSGSAPRDSGGEMSVYIGTNVEYAPYKELGTGQNYEGGRPTKWTYEDAKGQHHMTGGNTAKPFLKPAVADHSKTYRDIIEGEMKSG